MPKELMSCVKRVKKSGKPEDQAYAICSSSTGWKRKKGGWKKGSKVYKEKTNLPFFNKLVKQIIK